MPDQALDVAVILLSDADEAKLSNEDQQRLTNALGLLWSHVSRESLLTDSFINLQDGVAGLMQPHGIKEPLTATGTLVVRQVYVLVSEPRMQIFVLQYNDVEIMWLFMFPSNGSLVVTTGGCIFRNRNFYNTRQRLQNQVIDVDGQPGLVPDIHLSHNDFTLYGTSNNNLLVVAKNNDAVVTQ